MVGSISAYPDATTAFKQCAQRMPNRLKRIPDGETGERKFFTRWQITALKEKVPQVIAPLAANQAVQKIELSADEVEKGNAQLLDLDFETQYDDVAIESYATFKKSKDQGHIPKETRFQVCLPTSNNVAYTAYHQFRETLFDVHEKALFKAIGRIQNEIPHEQLSIQIDLAIDTALWEGVFETTWLDDPKEGVLDCILRLISQIEQDVEVGIHNCYGS